jgi:hypothetical protein
MIVSLLYPLYLILFFLFIRDQKSMVPLHVYLGKYVVHYSFVGGNPNTYTSRVEGMGKDLSW